MNVANLELCKKLYELSDWGHYFQVDDPGDIHVVDEKGNAAGLLGSGGLALINVHQLIPAYSLGYLLRKLPPRLPNDRYCLAVYNAGILAEDLWFAQYDGEPDGLPLHKNNGKTPEDAAAKLAIELFKQNILTKEKS